MRWLHFSRGLLTAAVLAFWLFWTLNFYRRKVSRTISNHDKAVLDLLQQIHEGVLTVDLEGKVQWWNHGFTRIMGWNGDVLAHPKYLSLFEKKYSILKEETEKGSVEYFDGLIRDTKGENKPVEIVETRFRDHRDTESLKMVIVRDVTERITRETDLQRSERMASLGNMAAGIAHEIGNPLAAISSLTQLMQRQTDNEKIQDNLTKIRDQVNRITKIVRELVDFSRPRALEISKTNLNHCITQAHGLMQHDARCRFVSFELDLDPDIPSLDLVPDQIFQVVLNLLINALDAVKGKENPKVVFRTSYDAERVILTCSDNGHGIPKEYIDRIFEPFFTTKEPGKGTGLGLSVSYSIIQKFGGELKVQSEIDKGTTFVLTLPKQ